MREVEAGCGSLTPLTPLRRPRLPRRRWRALPEIVRLDQLSAAVSEGTGSAPSYALVRGLADQTLRAEPQWRWDVSAGWQMVRKGARARCGRRSRGAIRLAEPAGKAPLESCHVRIVRVLHRLPNRTTGGRMWLEASRAGEGDGVANGEASVESVESSGVVVEYDGSRWEVRGQPAGFLPFPGASLF